MRIVILLVLVLLLGACATESSRRAYVDANRGRLNASVEKNLLAGKVCVGMSEDDVIASWGYPNKVRRHVVGGRPFVEYYYFETILYFVSGEVDGWTEVR